MLTKQQLAWAVGGLMAFSIAGAQAMQTAYANQTASVAVQITDSKLGPINMGLDSAQHWLMKMTPGDVQRGQKLINDLERLAARFQRITVSNDPQYQYVASRFTEIAKATIRKANHQPEMQSSTLATQSANQTVNSATHVNKPTTQQPIAKPHRNLPLVQSALQQVLLGLQKYDRQDIVEAQHLTEKMQYAQKLYQVVPASAHPDYAAATKLMNTIREQFAQTIPQWTSQADPYQFLAEMNKRYRQDLQLPEIRKMMRTRELTAEDVEYYLGSIDKFNATLERDLGLVMAAVITTRSRSDLSLVNWLQKDARENIQTTTKSLQSSLDKIVNQTIENAQRLAALDPKKNRYQFVTESVRNKHEQSFARALRTIENAGALEAIWQQPGRWTSRADELNTHISGYRDKAARANKVDELPDDIGNIQLTKIAKRTLALEKYGVGTIQKLIVNSKKVQRDRKTTRWFNDRLETTVRVWDEFQVCTVELEHGKHVVYFNTLRNFSRGAATTPIDTWIVANRFKSGEITAAQLN